MERSEEEQTGSGANPIPDKLALVRSLGTKAKSEHISNRHRRNDTFQSNDLPCPARTPILCEPVGCCNRNHWNSFREPGKRLSSLWPEGLGRARTGILRG